MALETWQVRFGTQVLGTGATPDAALENAESRYTGNWSLVRGLTITRVEGCGVCSGHGCSECTGRAVEPSTGMRA